jgi:hypothetical protein
MSFAGSDLMLGEEQTAVLAEQASPFIFLSLRGSSETSDTQRFQRAIDQAAAKGGGTVHIPAGRYIVGSVMLRSHVSLWLDNGAVVAMSSDDADFLPWEKLTFDPGANRATSDFHVALFVGDGVEHISIYGEGEIECDRGKKGGGPKPIALRRCNHVTLRGFTMRNAQNYNISMLGCGFVGIHNVKIHAGRADGIDPDCCHHVAISDCFIESVDDSLCLKASGSLGQRGACEHITVTNCVLRTASIHFKCGTESCGDFRSITLSNCILEGGLGMRHGNPGIAFYTVDEGSLEGITISNITMQNVGTPLAIIRGDRDRCGTHHGPGILNGIRISQVIAVGARLPSVIAGLPGSPVTNISIDNFSVSMQPDHKPHPEREVPEAPKEYPAPVMFGELPAFGIYLRHVENVSLLATAFEAPTGEERPDMVFDDVTSLRLIGQERRGAPGPRHLLLKDVQDSYVECLAISPPPAKSFHVTGAKTRNLYLQGRGAIDWHQHLQLESSVKHDAVKAH